MENETIISVKNIGKKYKITHQQGGYVALRDVLANIVKSPLKFLKQKGMAVTGLATREEFWALRGVNFEVKKGEVVGIIGRNGAGKSTLLKILSQITPPTEGEIKINGRVGSLLEVGTGFHPELSGRDNIFLNGAILGMTRREIASKFDEIVTFAGIEKFLDTPVKHYSSGMYVRLAFSVAAHMEPDILIIDEVLAVGDAEFQKKCLGKMSEITKTDGRTILFVSHNLNAIEQLCDKCILLDKGTVVKSGETKDVINFYLNKRKKDSAVISFPIQSNKEASILKISIIDDTNKPTKELPIDKKFFVEIEFEVKSKLEQAIVSLYVFSTDNDLLLVSSDGDHKGVLVNYEVGNYKTKIEIPAFLINAGFYYLNAIIQKPLVEYIDQKENIDFEIININNPRSTIFGGHIQGKIAVILKNNTVKIG